MPQIYVYAAQVVEAYLAHELGYLDYLINCECTKRSNGSGASLSAKEKEGIRKEIAENYKHRDCFSIKPVPGESTSKWVEFINGFSNDKLREAAADAYASKYPGMPLPDFTSVQVPDSVVQEYK